MDEVSITKKLTVLSLGAGVQSTALALMAARGEVVPMPDFAVFADTGWEPREVYDHLDWLMDELPYPVHVTSNGNIYKDLKDSATEGSRIANPPFYTQSAKGEKGILKRGCTTEYKVIPVIRKIREVMGFQKGQRIKDLHCTNWMGISLDEASRMKESGEKWITHRWPLIEKRMNRHDCLLWMEKNEYPKPPRSACVGCPYHSNDYWRHLKKNSPDEWDEACDMDDLIRNGINKKSAKDFQAEKLFTHPDMVPLREVDLRTDVDKGQLTFLDECDGVCML